MERRAGSTSNGQKLDRQVRDFSIDGRRPKLKRNPIGRNETLKQQSADEGQIR